MASRVIIKNSSTMSRKLLMIKMMSKFKPPLTYPGTLFLFNDDDDDDNDDDDHDDDDDDDDNDDDDDDDDDRRNL